MGASAVLVATLIGVTVPEPLFATYTVLPFGVITMAAGVEPTGIGASAVLVAVSIGVTVSASSLMTYAVLLFGVIAM